MLENETPADTDPAPFSAPSRRRKRQPAKKVIGKVHRWLSLAAVAFWLVQALTGLILVFHFEIEDRTLAATSPPTDTVAIGERLEVLGNESPDARVNFIWSTAGLPDRYVINYTSGDETRLIRINGIGETLRERNADDHSFLTMTRAIHLDLMAGRVGYWISAITGALLFSNICLGLYLAWPKRKQWRRTLFPPKGGTPIAKNYSWHRAVGLWAAIPALIIVATGVLMLFEDDLHHLLGVEHHELPPIAATASQASFKDVYDAAEAAIPGSYFVGTSMPSEADASYYAWVRAPGELYRNGYGGSLVIINANDASVRGAWPATEHGWRDYLLYSLYPLHTGEAGSLIGRLLVLLIGIWLLVTIYLGCSLWWHRRKRMRQTAA